MSDLIVKDFNFDLPEALIAQSPATNREQARLLFCHAGSFSHHIFADLPKLLPANTLLIANNTRVIPSRLIVTLKSGSEAELFLLESPKGQVARARALARPRKKLLRDQTATLTAVNMNLKITSAADSEEEVLVDFPCSEQEAQNIVQQQGLIPLPPYIKRDKDDLQQKEFDRERYQTIFHQHAGSSAAPTAGLHFSGSLIENLKSNGHSLSFVTLHVGLGTFAPIRSASPSEHQMHSEHYRIGQDTLAAISRQIATKSPIIFVGTTSLRAVESFMRKDIATPDMMGIADDWHSTNLFLYPRNREEKIRPKVGDGLITNFHLPQSTLYMLICALMGYEKTNGLYQEAIRNKYRFFSYGDASLLLW